MTLSRGRQGEVILSIDQGTTNTKALLVSRPGAPVFCTAAPLALIHSHPERIEQSPEAIWASVVNVASKCLSYAAESGFTIAGIAISNQRETALAWHRKDGRAAGQCRELAVPALGRHLPRSSAAQRCHPTQNGPSAGSLVTASKWRWMLIEDRGPAYGELADAGELCLGTVDSWLIYKLTQGGVHATDHSNASRTALLNLRALEWDNALLTLFEIPASALPQILPSSGNFGSCSAIPGLAGVPIVAAVGDSHAALAAHGCDTAGIIKATYGTGSSLMMLSGVFPEETSSLARTVAWSTRDGALYALEGNIAMTGSAVQWVGDFLGWSIQSDDAMALAARSTMRRVCFLCRPWRVWARRTGMPMPAVRSRAGAVAQGSASGAGGVDAIAYQVADVFMPWRRRRNRRCLSCTRMAARHETEFDAVSGRYPCPRRASLHHRGALLLGAAWLGGLALGWWKTLAEPRENTPPRRKEFVRTCPKRSANGSARDGRTRATHVDAGIA